MPTHVRKDDVSACKELKRTHDRIPAFQSDISPSGGTGHFVFEWTTA